MLMGSGTANSPTGFLMLNLDLPLSNGEAVLGYLLAAIRF